MIIQTYQNVSKIPMYRYINGDKFKWKCRTMVAVYLLKLLYYYNIYTKIFGIN